MRFSPIQKPQISKLTKRFEIFYCRHPKYLEVFIQKPGGSKQLPRVGPTRAEIIANLNTNETNLMVEVDTGVARKTATTPALGFSNKFKKVTMLSSDTIQSGDTFGLTIWESVEISLLAAQNNN